MELIKTFKILYNCEKNKPKESPHKGFPPLPPRSTKILFSIAKIRPA